MGERGGAGPQKNRFPRFWGYPNFCGDGVRGPCRSFVPGAHEEARRVGESAGKTRNWVLGCATALRNVDGLTTLTTSRIRRKLSIFDE